MSDQAPAATPGSGAVVPLTTRTRRTNLLSQMTPKERRAFLQTQLDADHMIKQMSAIRHGLPSAGERVILDDEVETEQVDTTVQDLVGLLRQKETNSQIERQVAMEHQNQQVEKVAAGKTDLSLGKLATIGSLAGVPGLAAVAALWSLWPDGDEPPAPQPPAVVAPADPVAADADTLSLLRSEGLSAPRTPLGEKTLEAFQKNPALREQVMQQIAETLTESEDD